MTKKKSKYIRERIKEESEVMQAIEKASITVQAMVYPCEDMERVSQCIRNVVDGQIREEKVSPSHTLLIIRAEGKDAVIRIFNHFRQRRVLATLRRYLNKYADDTKGEIILFLHKQAAFAGVLNLCEPGESPLGEIIVRIKVDEPRRIISWFTSF